MADGATLSDALTEKVVEITKAASSGMDTEYKDIRKEWKEIGKSAISLLAEKKCWDGLGEIAGSKGNRFRRMAKKELNRNSKLQPRNSRWMHFTQWARKKPSVADKGPSPKPLMRSKP